MTPRGLDAQTISDMLQCRDPEEVQVTAEDWRVLAAKTEAWAAAQATEKNKAWGRQTAFMMRTMAELVEPQPPP